MESSQNNDIIKKYALISGLLIKIEKLIKLVIKLIIKLIDITKDNEKYKIIYSVNSVKKEEIEILFRNLITYINEKIPDNTVKTSINETDLNLTELSRLLNIILKNENEINHLKNIHQKRRFIKSLLKIIFNIYNINDDVNDDDVDVNVDDNDVDDNDVDIDAYDINNVYLKLKEKKI